MREVVYDNPFGQTVVWECSRRELLWSVEEQVRNFIDGYGADDDGSIWIEYDDGSYFYLSGFDCDGRFKKQHIKGIIMADAAGYSVYGDYRMCDDNMNIELV